VIGLIILEYFQKAIKNYLFDLADFQPKYLFYLVNKISKARIRLQIEIEFRLDFDHQFLTIKAKFTKLEIGFLSSDWLNSNTISILMYSLIQA